MNKKTTTRKKDDFIDSCQDPKVVGPSKRTIEFLKLFARTYYVEKSLPTQLNDLCLN